MTTDDAQVVEQPLADLGERRWCGWIVVVCWGRTKKNDTGPRPGAFASFFVL